MDSYVKFNEVKIRHVIGMVLISVILSIAIGDAMNIEESNFKIISLLGDIILIIMLTYKLKLSKKNIIWLYEDFKKKIKLKEIFGVVATQICLSMGVVILLMGAIYMFSPSLINDLLNEDSIVSENNFALSFICIVITAPIVEELVFRGVIFKRLSKKFNIYVGIIVSSIIFGSLHLELAIVGAILFGVANCILYVKYRNILIPMLVHFINNLLVMITQLPLGNASNEDEVLKLTSNDLIMLFIVAGLLLIIGTSVFIRFINKNKVYLRNELSM